MQMTPEARRDLVAARLKVTAMSVKPCISDYPQIPSTPLPSRSLPVRSSRFISCGNNGERSEPINEMSREGNDGETVEKRGVRVALFMQSIGRCLSASLIVWFYRREGLFKQTRCYANGVAVAPFWQHLMGGWTEGLWEGFFLMGG